MIPGVLGLPYDYIASQFGAWRGGMRKATAPYCMANMQIRRAMQQLQARCRMLNPYVDGRASFALYQQLHSPEFGDLAPCP